MTDSKRSIEARDLISRLKQLKQDDASTYGAADNMSITGDRRVNRATSFDSLPRFTKSSTMSTTSSTSTRFSGLHSYPSAAVHRNNVEVSPGEFSMPRVPKRSRRGTNGSARSSRSEGRKKKDSFEAHAYGRHSNQWLFNDFSITDAVRKGCGKVFGRND
ncbi:uncharacterized protein EKO05_0007427 [Ascochyta rabiei]|uniref:uncharacterized protein n=1 Tax=Didymella rabiei TaxID=5454 RepID=UPI001901BBAB|nr:uncharacterized protein EKO05_0007427 [Ascochyta rabiei]UPX17050.1 hypothetical protein EKO05_0007427 [Ascochyta rabiei]